MTDCLFCRISAGAVPADIVYEDTETVAFRDIQPQAPVHILVVPRTHIPGIDSVAEMDAATLGRLFGTTARVASSQGLDRRGYRVVVNNGPDAQQSVRHLHIHLIGGRPMEWPPG